MYIFIYIYMHNIFDISIYDIYLYTIGYRLG